MVLTDREIQIALSCQQIEIDPSPPLQSFSSTSVDLTLAEDGAVWKATAGVQIRPGNKDYKYSALIAHQEKVKISNFEFAPGSFLLAWTRESVNLLPTSRLAARIEGKSSIARLGIGVHVTAPTIHAGFRGQIQLEMYNVGPNTIVLDPGLKICQLIFEYTSGTPEKGYAGMFSGQTSVP